MPRNPRGTRVRLQTGKVVFGSDIFSLGFVLVQKESITVLFPLQPAVNADSGRIFFYIFRPVLSMNFVLVNTIDKLNLFRRILSTDFLLPNIIHAIHSKEYYQWIYFSEIPSVEYY